MLLGLTSVGGQAAARPIDPRITAFYNSNGLVPVGPFLARSADVAGAGKLARNLK
jgi:hypothetical protein